MSVINTLDSLRFYELGPFVSAPGQPLSSGLITAEVEVKNIYRILRVLEPLIRSLSVRGGLLNISIDSVGAGTSLIHDNTLPDWFLRSLKPGTNITITTSADGKEITIASTDTVGVGNHQISDDVVHADVADGTGKVDTNEEDGTFLAWDGQTNNRWELSDIGNSFQDVLTGADRSMGCFRGFEANIRNFGANNSIGGRHTMRMIKTVSGSFLTLAKEVATESILISFDAASFELGDISDVVISDPLRGALLTFIDGSGFLDQTSTMRFTRVDATTAGPEHNFRSARGGIGPPRALTAALNGDELGQINFRGHDGVSGGEEDARFNIGARIQAKATENFSNTANGTKLEFSTVDNGSSTLDLRVTIDQDGKVTVAKTLAADAIEVTQTGQVANLNADKLDAAGTGRDWDTVQYTKQRPLSFIDFVTAGTDAATWLTGAIGHVLTKVATGTPPAESVIYAGQIPTGFSATPVLKWRFYNDTVQTGGDQKDVLWRVQYNSPGSSGTIGAADTGTPTTTLATDQAQNTIIEESLSLSNVAAGDLFNVTLSVDSAVGTTLAGDVVLLGVPWLEFVQAGVPDTGTAS